MEAGSSRALRRLEPGARVGSKYRLVRRIATGGMGEVWRARNEATSAEVAVKISRRTHGDDLDLRFRTEAKLGSMVAHRNIVRIFDLVEDDHGSLVLVMELLRGEALGHHLKTCGRLGAKEAIAIASAILSGLSHAHAEGIVHRDVTPANVFLAVDPDGLITPKLIDFGIAKLPAAGPHTLDGRVLGTPRYMAPEQIRGLEIDGRADLFSLAVVLYEALTGICPFEAGSPSASLAAVLETEVDPDPEIELRVWLELSRALGKRPYERHPSAAAFADALRLAIGETEASLTPLLRREPPSRSDEDDEVQPPRGSTTIEGQSVESQAVRTRPAWPVWAATGAAAACLAWLAASVLRAPHDVTGTHAPTAASAAPVTTAVPADSSPPAIDTTSLPSEAPAAPTDQAAPPTAPKPRPRPIPHRSPRKDVGLKPGF